MPRPFRITAGGFCYHVINRGNGRAEVFHKLDDYAAFVRLIGEACEQVPMRLLAWCLMPNHFHLVVCPHEDGDLSTWMQWLMTSHVRRYHRHYHTAGHVWQGRFRSFPIEEDEHLLSVVRYVELNPVRATSLDVSRVADWPWSSAGRPLGIAPPSLDLEEIFPDARARLPHRLTQSQLDQIKRSLDRGSPLGSPRWQKRTAKQLGLQSTLRPRGRPRKK